MYEGGRRSPCRSTGLLVLNLETNVDRLPALPGGYRDRQGDEHHHRQRQHGGKRQPREDRRLTGTGVRRAIPWPPWYVCAIAHLRSIRTPRSPSGMDGWSRLKS